MNMKWNWGTKLAIWIIAFIVFILTLVYMTTFSEINLVEKDYYPKGLKYQSRIDAIENAKEANAVFTIEQTNNGITMVTPEIMVDSGTIMFFRPSGNSLDRTYSLVINNERKLIFPIHEFSRGKYLIKINWNHKDKEYYVEQSFFVR